MRHRSRPASRGQVLVIFALGVTLLIAAAGIAVDVGRFYSERRFLQNAADAAALAAANALVAGESDADAIISAQNTLTTNFAADPNGVIPSLPPATPVYELGHPGDGAYLTSGIVISGGTVRVAVTNSINYTFGRVIGLGNQAISARAMTELRGDALPIAVRRFINSPGPNTGATYPCSDNSNKFMDFFATDATSCLGSETDASLRSSPNAGAAFDSSNPGSDATAHGPVVAILGQGAQPANGADFRGFVALDIRNFQSSMSQLYYNGVTSGTNSNTLKAFEAGWIASGYPGPLFPSVVYPPDPNDQVAVMSGNSTGIVISAVTDRFRVGQEVLVLVYPGNVMAIPDFTLAPPAELDLQATGTLASAGTLKAGRNQAFSGQVTLTTLGDALDPQNPMTTGALVGGSSAITYNPNPVTPSLGSGTSVSLQNVTTSGATPGIYTIWVEGQAGSPYLTTKVQPMAVMIGTVSKDFAFTSGASNANVASGSAATFDLQLQNSPSKNTNFGNPVALSVDAPLPAGIGSVTFSSPTVSPSKAGAHSTLTINTGTMAPGVYTFTLRATGTNTDSTPHKVTHLFQVTVNVGGSGTTGNQDYVDISGFAVMRIAAIDSNTISAYAITPVITDMNDPLLRRGQVARLVPWN